MFVSAFFFFLPFWFLACCSVGVFVCKGGGRGDEWEVGEQNEGNVEEVNEGEG